MKICFVIIAFQADHTLEACLRSIAPFGQIICAEGPVGFWRERGYVRSTDKTLGILKALHVATLCEQWGEKDDMVRAAMQCVPSDTDFVWFVDADEIWDEPTIRKILALLESGRVDAMAFKPWSFYGGFERIMGGFEENFAWHRISRMGEFQTHRPPTLLAPNGMPWREQRFLSQHETARLDLRFHHYSYVFPSQMEMKAQYYASKGGTIPNYFRVVYLPWVMHPEFRQAIEETYQGVHDWIPKNRGDCYTRPFKGSHPPEILARLPAMRERFNRELEAYR